jgi:acetyltransferase-like isoleucine patch superfamily enzyme
MSIIFGVMRIWRTERALAGWIRFLARTKERCSGRLRAWIIGWPQGFLGSSSRVIGTAFIKAGSQCSVGRFAWVEAVLTKDHHSPLLEIGDRFSASERLHIACSNLVTIGVDCLLGSGVHITDHNHGNYKGNAQSKPDEAPISRPIVSSGAVVIGDRVWIGDNCVIIGPARIGTGAVVAANSVVTKDVPPNVIVAGVPARIIKQFDPLLGQWVNADQINNAAPNHRASINESTEVHRLLLRPISSDR